MGVEISARHEEVRISIAQFQIECWYCTTPIMMSGPTQHLLLRVCQLHTRLDIRSKEHAQHELQALLPQLHTMTALDISVHVLGPIPSSSISNAGHVKQGEEPHICTT